MSFENPQKVNGLEKSKNVEKNAVDQNISRSEQLRFDEIIASFDFDKLNDLTNELARDVGYHDALPHSLGRDSFYELATNKKGDYDPEQKRIGLGVKNIEQIASEASIDPKKLAAHGIIHEEMHAISGQHHLLIWSPFKLDIQVGFDRRGDTSQRVYWLWNEGVTEKLARETYRKYASAKHIATEEEVDMYMEKVKEHGRSKNEFYQPEVDLVERFIERVAKEVGVDTALVWKAVVGGLLRGEKWYASEFEELAQDILPPNFMHDVEGISTHRTAQRLTQELLGEKADKKFRTSKIVRKIKRVTEKYIESLKNSVNTRG